MLIYLSEFCQFVLKFVLISYTLFHFVAFSVSWNLALGMGIVPNYVSLVHLLFFNKNHQVSNTLQVLFISALRSLR